MTFQRPNERFSWVGGKWSSQSDLPTFPSRCIEVQDQPATINAQIWAKPQPNNAVAVFVLNGLDRVASFDVDLVKDLGMDVDWNSTSFVVHARNIWEHTDLPNITEDATQVSDAGARRSSDGNGSTTRGTEEKTAFVLHVENVPSRDSRFYLLTPSNNSSPAQVT